MLDDRNAGVLEHVMDYCNEIQRTISRFGNNYEVFSKDTVYQNAIALCVLQIGELTTHFSDDFKLLYNEMPWTQMKALRNVVAHNYGKIDIETLWETIIYDIPQLLDYCITIMKHNNLNNY